MDKKLEPSIRRILIIPLYSHFNEFSSTEEALKFLDTHAIHEAASEFRKYELRIEFSNGDKIDAIVSTKDKVKVREFLRFASTQ